MSGSIIEHSGGTYTGATEVAGPGSVLRVGNAEAQDCSTSRFARPAGKVKAFVKGFTAGMTSEQSMRDLFAKLNY